MKDSKRMKKIIGVMVLLSAALPAMDQLIKVGTYSKKVCLSDGSYRDYKTAILTEEKYTENLQDPLWREIMIIAAKNA